MKKTLLVWLLLSGSVMAKNLGIYGPTYKIAEMDVFDWIVNQRLPELENNGEIDKMNAKLQKRAQHRIENPKGPKLPKATKNSRKTQSLVYTLPRDIKDAAGRVLFKNGTTVRPEDILPDSNKTLLFIDGEDLAQVNFAFLELKKNRLIKIVLVVGHPLELMRKCGVNIYFDQHQKLIDRFDINALPAKVYRRKSELIIEEMII